MAAKLVLAALRHVRTALEPNVSGESVPLKREDRLETEMKKSSARTVHARYAHATESQLPSRCWPAEDQAQNRRDNKSKEDR